MAKNSKQKLKGQRLGMLCRSGLLLLFFLWVCLSGTPAFAASVAVFPLQELGKGRNEANLPLTRLLVEKLASAGNEVISMKAVISFMANNRIRTLGHLESYYITHARNDLGASFILLGTVSQQRELPEPSVGLTLNLVRTSDGRTVWTYVDSISISDRRQPLGVREPRSIVDLQGVLLDELAARWPNTVVREIAQQKVSIYIDQAWLEPRQIRPGETVQGQVRLRKIWAGGQAPQIFFRAEDKLYPATLAADGQIWQTSWVAGNTNGNYPVTLLLQWPDYGRSETALLGNYLIDGTPPLFEIELRGAQQLDGRSVFNHEVVIFPRLLVRKQLSRWQLSFYNDEGDTVGTMNEDGQLPERLIWAGRGENGSLENGVYKLVLEAWDLAGNTARAEQLLEINRNQPNITMSVGKDEKGVSVDLGQEGKLPLEIWRLEIWTNEGRILARQEGRELPVKINLNIPDAALRDVQGFVFIQDILGNRARRSIEELLPKTANLEAEKKEEANISKKWVDEF